MVDVSINDSCLSIGGFYFFCCCVALTISPHFLHFPTTQTLSQQLRFLGFLLLPSASLLNERCIFTILSQISLVCIHKINPSPRTRGRDLSADLPALSFPSRLKLSGFAIVT